MNEKIDSRVVNTKTPEEFEAMREEVTREIRAALEKSRSKAFMESLEMYDHDHVEDGHIGYWQNDTIMEAWDGFNFVIHLEVQTSSMISYEDDKTEEIVGRVSPTAQEVVADLKLMKGDLDGDA